MPKTVIIADDHPFATEGMTSLVETIPELEVVGTAENGIQAIALIKKTKPDCALLDLSMPGANGLEVFLEAKRWSPDTKFAIVTGISAAAVFKQLYDAGIDGLFVKNETPEQMRQGILEVSEGKRVISEQSMQAIKRAQEYGEFTKRELQVLQGLARGQSNIEIADWLGLSPKTVDSHRSNLRRKLNVNNTASLIVKAIRAGLVDVPD